MLIMKEGMDIAHPAKVKKGGSTVVLRQPIFAPTVQEYQLKLHAIVLYQKRPKVCVDTDHTCHLTYTKLTALYHE